ncbi:MAG: hypothetical protein OCD76_00425 [Reichenbachiella sp.]
MEYFTKKLIIGLLLMISTLHVSARGVSFSGTVTDSRSGLILPDVTVIKEGVGSEVKSDMDDVNPTGLNQKLYPILKNNELI